MAHGFVSFSSISITEAEEEVKGPEYSGRTENVAPISRIKEMGLPATGKVTLASAVVMVMVWALEPGPRQSSGARPSRSGTVNSGATSPTEEGLCLGAKYTFAYRTRWGW